MTGNPPAAAMLLPRVQAFPRASQGIRPAATNQEAIQRAFDVGAAQSGLPLQCFGDNHNLMRESQ